MSKLKNLANESTLVSQKTIAHYDQNAVSYDQGTKDHDVSQNIDALLRAIKTEQPFHILDFGCGPGRDLHHRTALALCGLHSGQGFLTGYEWWISIRISG